MSWLHITARILTLSLVVLIGTDTLYAQAGGAVVPIKKRKEILEKGDAWLNQKDPELKASFSQLPFPFAFKEEEVPEPVAVAVEEKPKEPELTDRDVLDQIAPKINATGTLIRGSTSYLIFPNGQLPDGGTIRLNFKDKTYTIYVTDVTSTGYNLRLNNEVYRKKFGEKSSGSIERAKTPN